MTVYNVALADREGFFGARIRELCGAQNLTFFLVEPLWVQEFVDKLQQGELAVDLLIDMASNPYDQGNLYYQLARQVKASGGHVIDDPDLSPIFAHKGKFHAILLKNGVLVPETIIVPRQELSGFCLTEEAKARLGVPFVVKPGWGGAQEGVILHASTKADLLRSAELAPISDSFLLQKRVVPKSLDGRVGWFRVFHICGEIIPCWWHPGTSRYEMVSPLQCHHFGLAPLEQIVHRIAKLSGMEFFSTEIALTEQGHFIAVDYLNDECDTHPQSYWPPGPPDELVRYIAWAMVQRARALLHRHPFENELREWDKVWQEREQLKGSPEWTPPPL